MKKSMLWLPFIAMAFAPNTQAMLGQETALPKKEDDSSQSSSTSAKNDRNNGQSSAETDSKTPSVPGVSDKDVSDFLSKTKDMSPEELQKYLKNLQSDIESGQVQPNEVDSAMPENFQPHGKKTGKRPKRKSIKQLQNEQAFDGLVSEVLPLSPDQIMKLHKYYDLSLQAKATPPKAPPTPHVSSMPVSLEPGSESPVIRLSAGFVSTLLFVDRTGAPWPITAYSLGDPTNFNIQWDGDSNTMFMQSTKRYVHANMAVRLVGLNTPVMLTLVSGQKDIDFRVDLQLQSRGPEAFPAVVDQATYAQSNVNSDMINMLDGIPPQGSIKLKVNGDYAQAWSYKGKVYYRSKITLLSPAWTATVSSPDGTHVYEIMPTPYLLASKDGQTINIKLTGL